MKVIFRKGGHFCDIHQLMETALKSGDICCDCLSEIVLVVGGNNAQNANSLDKILTLNDTFTNLIDFATHSLPNTRINVFSVIPRKLVDPYHLGRIIHANDYMSNICGQYQNCRYINISTHFLTWNRQYNEMMLNWKLFNDDLIHFNKVGTSVIAKVIIGVIYRPYF